MSYRHRRVRHKLFNEHFLYYGNRVVNFRPIFFSALSFGLGIFCCLWFGLKALYVLCLLIATIPAALFAGRHDRSRIAPFLLASVAMFSFFALGCLSFAVRIADFERQPVSEGPCLVTGVVRETAVSQKNVCYTLDVVMMFDENDQSEIQTDYRIRIYVYGNEAAFSDGDVVTFSADLTTLDAWSYGKVNASAILDRVRFRAFVAQEDMDKIGKEGTDIFAQANSYLREILNSSMDKGNASLAYAMLTGNSGFMDEDVLQNFRYGGVAHIFAVSGLHIGLVYALFAFLLKKCRAPVFVRLPLISAVLIFFAGICGFSPSSVRALIMCIVVMLTNAAGTGLDRLSSVSLASFVVLAVNPVYLFSVGFQLSVAAAAGIIVLGGHLTRLLSRILHFPRKLSSALGTAFSAQVCTFPILIDSFGYVSAFSFVLNLFFIPVISAVFALLFVGTLLACLFSFAADWLLFLPQYFLSAAVLPIMALDFKVGLICGFSFGTCAALWYFIVWFLSDKINLKVWAKAAGFVFLSAILTFCMLAGNLSWGSEVLLTVHGYYESGFVLLRHSDRTALISFGVPDASHLEQVFLKEGISRIDAFLPTGGAQVASSALPVLLQLCPVGAMYVSADWDYVNSFRTVPVYEKNGVFEVCGGYADFLGEQALYLYFSDTSFVLANDTSEETSLPECDVLIARSQQSSLLCVSSEQIFLERTEGKLCLPVYGDLQICRKNDIISVKEVA